MFKILLAVLCLLIISQDVQAKATKKAKSKTAGWFAKLTPAKQVKVMEAIRDYNLAAEKWHPLAGEAAKKRAFLFGLINEAQAQEPGGPPPAVAEPDDNGAGDEQVGGPGDDWWTCRFGGWKSIVRPSPPDNAMRCIHPNKLTGDEAKVNNPPYNHGNCNAKTEIMCSNFLNPGKCVAYKTATANCLGTTDEEKKEALDKAVAYARDPAHAEEFERYVKEIVGECRADADKIEGFDAIRKDQRSTCRILKDSLTKLDEAIKAAIEAEELEAGKANSGASDDDICSFKADGKDYQIHRSLDKSTPPKSTIAIRSGGKIVGTDVALYETGRVEGTPPREAFKIRSTLGFLTFYRPTKGGATVCDSAYLSVEPHGTLNTGTYKTCHYKTPGQTKALFKVEWDSSGTGKAKIFTQKADGTYELYRDGTMEAGVWKTEIAPGKGRGVPVTYQATGDNECGHFRFDFGTPAATPPPGASSGGQQ